MIHVVAFMECNGQAIALGRTDQYLYPFYQKSLEDGTYTKDFMQELLEFFYLKLTTHEKLAPDTGNDQWRGGVRGWTSSALIVGGTDKDGQRRDQRSDLYAVGRHDPHPAGQSVYHRSLARRHAL